MKAMLDEAGYSGERIVLHASDRPALLRRHVISVVADAFRKVGLNIDEQSMDWGTVVQRRTNKEPLDKGGWSIFPAGYPAAEYRDPILATNAARQRRKAWFGWPDDPKMEATARAVDGQHRRGGEAHGWTRTSSARRSRRALHPARAVPAAGGLAQQPDRAC